MKPYCLASSSAGNCFIFEFEVNGIPTRIMVECGIPLKDIYNKASSYNIDISSIKACLITHSHGDHCRAARDIARIGIPIFATQPTLEALNIKGEELVELTKTKLCDGIYLLPFAVEHDCPGSVGFIIRTHSETVVFINDHKRWLNDLRNFKPNYVFIECNYDHKVVYAQYYALKKKLDTCSSISRSEYLEIKTKLAQHERNLNSHCSLNGTLKGLKKLNLSQCSAIFLLHLSDRYANEYRMKNEIQKQTKILTYVAQKIGGFK